MKDRKISSEELLQYSASHIKVLTRFKTVSEELDDFLYPFVSPKELKVIGKVLVKINRYNKERESENNE